MKKIITIIMLTLIGLLPSANASDKIDVVKYSTAGGLTDRMNDIIAESLGDKFGQFVNVNGCAAAKRVIENSENPTVAAWSVEYLAEDNSCLVDREYFKGTMASAQYYICHMSDNKKAATMDYFRKGNIKVAVWDSAFWSVPQTDFVMSANPKAKVIRYKSKQFSTALPSGEVDYKMSTIPKDGETCLIVLGDTGEGIATGKSLGTESKFSELGYAYVIVGTEDVQDTVHNSEAWTNRKDTKYGKWDVSYSQVSRFLNEIADRMR